MKKKKRQRVYPLLLALMLGVVLGSGNLFPGDRVVMQMQLHEGFKGESGTTGNQVVSSYHLKPLSEASVLPQVEQDKVEQTLKRVFSLTQVNLMAEAQMILSKEVDKKPGKVVVLNGRTLLIQVSPLQEGPNRFKVEVLEDSQPQRSLLETKMILPESKTTVLGFEDSGGRIYFLSFYRSLDTDSSEGKPVSAYKTEKSPKLLHKVDPKYPEEAVKNKIEGAIIVDATTDIDGKVIHVKAQSGPEILRKAAEDSIKQWVYSPFIKNGQKKQVKFTVTVIFKLKKGNDEEKPINISSKDHPKKLRGVEPVYPPDAIKKGIQGKVVIEATIDGSGKVIKAEVVDGVPELDQAALDAVKQWVYQPFIVNGVAKTVSFTVVVKFALKHS